MSDLLNKARATYGRRKCGPPAITTAQFEAVATSPHLLGKSTSPSSREIRHNSSVVKGDRSASGQETTDHATIPKLILLDGATNRRHDVQTLSYLTGCLSSQRRRLFQSQQRRIRRSVDKKDPHRIPEKEQDGAPRLSTSQACQVDVTAGLELANDVDPLVMISRSNMSRFLHNDSLAGVSSIVSIASKSELERQGQPLSVLRRKLYSYTTKDIPLRDLQVTKDRRNVRPDSCPKLSGHIGDGFEPTERMSRRYQAATRRRTAARPRPTRCGQLVLLAGSPPVADTSLQQFSTRQHQPVQTAGMDAEVLVDGAQHKEHTVSQLDSDLKALHGDTQHEWQPMTHFAPVRVMQDYDDEVQRLFQSISAPVRPPSLKTEATESSTGQSQETDHPSQDSPHSNPSSDESWSGLVATPEQHSPRTHELTDGLYASPPSLKSPVSSLLSSSDVFELLEHITTTTSPTCPIEAVPRHGSLTFPLNRVLNIKATSALHGQVEILCSEGAVLETSQPLG
ncbi:hypothetical protein AMS68_004881 [Peltaster fructicola]|uniref:Uncharacterized protein n=1 Tax=Peltaster fructicola TaxID=286661 RepID=A0A6H0XXA9_9PEZI|nr:hypothetical protein AMS68_004881 [Peltaster fructicola]